MQSRKVKQLLSNFEAQTQEKLSNLRLAEKPVAYKKTLGICALSALGTAAALTLLALYLIRQKQIDDEDWFANYPTHDCRGDGFKGIYYNFTNRRGIQVRR